VYDRFIRKLKERMTRIRVGPSLDKGIDMGALVDSSQLKTIQKYISLCDCLLRC
jgi:aldehyde dehydrogenase (NAD+)